MVTPSWHSHHRVIRVTCKGFCTLLLWTQPWFLTQDVWLGAVCDQDGCLFGRLGHGLSSPSGLLSLRGRPSLFVVFLTLKKILLDCRTALCWSEWTTCQWPLIWISKGECILTPCKSSRGMFYSGHWTNFCLSGGFMFQIGWSWEQTWGVCPPKHFFLRPEYFFNWFQCLAGQIPQWPIVTSWLQMEQNHPKAEQVLYKTVLIFIIRSKLSAKSDTSTGQFTLHWPTVKTSSDRHQ